MKIQHRRRLLLQAGLSGLAAASARAHALPIPHNNMNLMDFCGPLQRRARTAPRTAADRAAIDIRHVRLLPSLWQAAQQRDHTYLLVLEPARLLSRVADNAGAPREAEPYGGWERDDVAGQTLGHYLTAASLMFACTGDALLRDRVAHTVGRLAQYQRAIGNGFVGAVPDWRRHFEQLAQRDGHMTGWVPWYSQHKIMAGLRDAWLHAGIDDAMPVLLGLCAWAEATIAPLTEAQLQTMLDTEHGGMNELLADVYALTGDARWLTLAQRFTHRVVIDPLAAGRDELDGLHANTQIPKLVGEARLHQLTAEPRRAASARFFWKTVVEQRSYVIGGNSSREHFFPRHEAAQRLVSSTAETCNTYNMLRLTKLLFEGMRDPALFEFYERAVTNHLLGANDPKRGMFSYFTPLRPGHFRIYSHPFDAMWCCVGTGMENPPRFSDAIWWVEGSRTLLLELYVPNELTLLAAGLVLRLTADLPRDPVVRLQLRSTRRQSLRLLLRVPQWAGGRVRLRVAGKSVPLHWTEDHHLVLDREWGEGETAIELHLQAVLGHSALPGDDTLHAFTYGPLALAGDLGTDGLDKVEFWQDGHKQDRYGGWPDYPVPPLLGTPENVLARVRPLQGSALKFTVGTGLAAHDRAYGPTRLTLIPFSQTHFRRYAVYWSVLDSTQWAQRREEIARAAAARRALQLRIVDQVFPGEQQSERDHALAGERTFSGFVWSGAFREARDGGWFSYRMAVDAEQSNELVLVVWGSDSGNRRFDIFIDEQRLATENIQAPRPQEFVDRVFPIPREWTRGRSHVVVRFVPHAGHTAGGIFGFRMQRSVS